jgi:hypothetical protein
MVLVISTAAIAEPWIERNRGMPSPWNSLEVTKLIVSLATPALVVWLTYQVGRFTSRLERTQWANQKLIEKRLQIFDDVAPELNDLYCYFCRIGNWKELSPPDVISKKRELDRRVHVYEPLLPDGAIAAYDSFMAACFQTFSKPGTDAKLLTPIVTGDGDRSKVFPGTWDAKWNDMFAAGGGLSSKDVWQRYHTLMSKFSQAIGISRNEAAH